MLLSATLCFEMTQTGALLREAGRVLLKKISARHSFHSGNTMAVRTALKYNQAARKGCSMQFYGL